MSFRNTHVHDHMIAGFTHRATSTAAARSFGSFPLTLTLAVNAPSILKTTTSVAGGSTARWKSTDVWSPRTTIFTGCKPCSRRCVCGMLKYRRPLTVDSVPRNFHSPLDSYVIT